MELITDYYEFKIVPNGIRYLIKPIKKFGNQSLLNNIFKYHDKLWVHQCIPNEIKDYVSYFIGTNNGLVSWLPLIFEMSLTNRGFGIFKSVNAEHNDAIIFKLDNEGTFEIFVIADKKADVLNYFQLMIAGDLESDFAAIKSKCI